MSTNKQRALIGGTWIANGQGLPRCAEYLSSNIKGDDGGKVTTVHCWDRALFDFGNLFLLFVSMPDLPCAIFNKMHRQSFDLKKKCEPFSRGTGGLRLRLCLDSAGGDVYPLAFGPSILEAAFRCLRSFVSPSSRSRVGDCIPGKAYLVPLLRGASDRSNAIDAKEY